MTDYYNEIDPYAAQFLRNLIAGGHIPYGHVDTRSIEDVTPADLAGYTQCHFFAGLGGWPLALQLAGWPRDRPVWTGSCPCQPFSAAGKGNGFEDERHLWPAWQHLVSECRPSVVFGEQVASKAAEPWIDLVHADLEALGYAFGCIPFPAAGVGAPHIRDRNYWVAHASGQRWDRRQGPEGRCQRDGNDARWFQGDHGSFGADEARLRVANTSGGGRYGRRPGEAGAESSAVERPYGLRDDGGLGHTHGERQGAERGIFDRPESEPRRGGEARGMGYADSDGTRRDTGALRGEEAGEGGRGCGDDAFAPGPCVPVGLGDAKRDGLRGGGRQDADIAHESGDGSLHAVAAPDAGPTNGLWRAADWLACRDGKWRPVEPGTFPLAHGVSGRVGRLRAYGNAIVPQAAAEFIRAFAEASGLSLEAV